MDGGRNNDTCTWVRRSENSLDGQVLGTRGFPYYDVRTYTTFPAYVMCNHKEYPTGALKGNWDPSVLSERFNPQEARVSGSKPM